MLIKLIFKFGVRKNLPADNMINRIRLKNIVGI